MLEKSKVKAQCTLQIHARHGQIVDKATCMHVTMQAHGFILASSGVP